MTQPSRGSATSIAALAGVVALALAGALAVAVLPGARPAAARLGAPAPYAADWTCPAVAGGAGSVTVANLAAAPLRLAVAALGPDGPTASASPPAAEPSTLSPGAASSVVRLAPRLDGAVSVSAVGGPAAVLAHGSPRCARAPGGHWLLPYADTRRGTDTVVVLADPGAADAFVDLVLHTAAGRVSLASLTAIEVKAGETRTVALRRFAPDLTAAVEVIARSGAVVPGARIVRGSSSRTLATVVVSGQPVASSSWAFTGGRAGGGTSTDLLLGNPGDAPLGVSFEVTTTAATFTPPGFAALEVPAGAMLQVPIELGLQAGDRFAVRVASRDRRAFGAALLVSSPATSAAPAGAVIDVGAAAPDTAWVSGGGRLVLFNPAAAAQRVSIRSIDGSAPAGSSSATTTVPARSLAFTTAPAGLVAATSAGPFFVAPLDGSAAVPRSAVTGPGLRGPVQPGRAARP